MHNKVLLVSVLFILFFRAVQAQNVTPQGQFLSDSVKIGESVAYTLSLNYPRGTQVVFPDSTYNFSPFEYAGKEFFPTRSDSTTSTDSTVYYLTTFEIDKIQHLSLPVYIIKDADSIPIMAATDSVFLTELIPVLADTLEVKEDTDFREVERAFNYPLLVAILVGVFIVLVVVLFIFGKQIRQKINLYRLKRAHLRFKQKFEEMMKKPDRQAEKLLLFWKNYMEDLEKKPYTKLTTKEILLITEHKELETSLKSIDRGIYSHHKKADLNPDFLFLSGYATHIYGQKVEEVSNAK